jgi:hypothetical protein
MKRLIIKGAGVLYTEIILTALQEYRKQCKTNGNHCRADVVNDIIDAIEFDHSDF